VKGFLVSVAAVAALIAAPVHAETFDFSFTNTGGTVSGTVTGEIVGLSDNSTGPATAIYIDSYPSSTGLDLTATTPFNVLTAATNIADNSFT
jgi:hypothetical protein